MYNVWDSLPIYRVIFGIDLVLVGCNLQLRRRQPTNISTASIRETISGFHIVNYSCGNLAVLNNTAIPTERASHTLETFQEVVASVGILMH